MGKRTYLRVGRRYQVDEILPLIRPEGEGAWGPKRALLDGDLVNTRSSRLFTFAHSHVCVCCGVAGAFFVKERHRTRSKKDGDFCHLNLYAIDGRGREVLMTSDHIVPRSKSKGLGLRDNRQTMCSRCNHAKGNREISNEELARELGIGNRHGLGRSVPQVVSEQAGIIPPA